MNGGNHLKVVKTENGRRVTFIQPHMLRRIQSERHPRESNRPSGEYIPHNYVARQKPRSPERLVRVVIRRNDVNSEADDMYRVTRTKRYESYTEDSENETDYSSDYSTGEIDREVYVYPRKRKLVKVIPISRNSSRYNDREILSGSRTNLKDNENTSTGNRYILERKQPARTLDEHRIISRMKPYIESDSDSSFSSDENDVDSNRGKVRLIRVIPRDKISPTRNVKYYKDNLQSSQGYTRQRTKSPEIIRKETVLVPVTKRYVTKPPSDTPNGFHQHLTKSDIQRTGISVNNRQTPVHRNKLDTKPSGITQSQSMMERDAGPQRMYGKIIASSQSEQLSQSQIRNSYSKSSSRTGISVNSPHTPMQRNNLVKKPGIIRSRSMFERNTGPQRMYRKVIASSPPSEQLNQNHIRNSYSTSSSSSHTSSDSDSESSDSGTSSSDSSISENDSSADQTSRLLLDYSKMLKSREEQKLYEKARKNYEHDKNIVSLVQKEINTPRRKVNKSDKSQENTEKSSVDEKQPKPLPSGENVIRRLKAAEEIKENIEIEKLRKKKNEGRGQVEAWSEHEEKERNRRKINKNSIHPPSKFYKRKKRSPEISNKYEIPDNVEVHVNYNNEFEDIYPEPRQKGCEKVYFIDLTKPAEKTEPKPFDEAKRRIVPQPKKSYDGPLVKVGGGWNTLNDYMERHVPVRKFEYQRQTASKSELPDLKKKYYGFHSNYKVAKSNKDFRPL